jgi:hypothetical protein
MSSPNGSIANLLVTRKSLFAGNLQDAFPVPFLNSDDSIKGRAANKKPALGRRRRRLEDVVPPHGAARKSSG